MKSASGVYYEKPKLSDSAIASVVVAILFPPLGFLVANKAAKDIRDSYGILGGRRLVVTARVLSVIFCLAWVFIIATIISNSAGTTIGAPARRKFGAGGGSAQIYVATSSAIAT